MARDRRREAGSAVVEVTWLVILLLVPLVYVVLAVFEVQRAAFAASAAARSAGRAYVLSESPGDGQARARQAAAVAFADQGVASRDARLRIGCRPELDCLAPGSQVHVSVTFQVALPLVPTALGNLAPSIRVHTEHIVPYGTFREDRS